MLELPEWAATTDEPFTCPCPHNLVLAPSLSASSSLHPLPFLKTVTNYVPFSFLWRPTITNYTVFHLSAPTHNHLVRSLSELLQLTVWGHGILVGCLRLYSVLSLGASVSLSLGALVPAATLASPASGALVGLGLPHWPFCCWKD